jgi:hypothetical protein
VLFLTKQEVVLASSDETGSRFGIAHVRCNSRGVN